MPPKKISGTHHYLWIALLVISFALNACGSDAQPTQDLGVYYTAAAQTIAVQLSEQPGTQGEPASTESPISSEPIPPPPPLLTASVETNQGPSLGGGTIPPLPLETPLAGLPTQQPGIVATLPIAVNTPPSLQASDKCVYLEQDPPDGLIYSPNFSFDASWSLKNSGATTWNKLYRVVWYNVQGSERIGPGLPREYNLTNSVAPGEVYRALVDMKTGLTPGKYTSSWVIQNAEGISFCFFTLEVIIQTP